MTPKYVIDTDTLSHYRRGHAAVARHVAAHQKDEMAATVITLEEQLSGWYSAVRKAKTVDQLEYAYLGLAETVQFYVDFTIINYSKAAILRFQSLARMKLKVGSEDLRIAAIALECGAIVATCNVQDFQRVPGLLIEDWSK